MPTFLFLVAICLLVAASILRATDASPKPNKNKKLEKGSSSSGKAQSTPALQLTPGNQWDPDARHEDLTLIDANPLGVQSTGEKREWRFLFAKQSIPKEKSGIFYYEVKILKKRSVISIGLATKQMELGKCVGRSKNTYEYTSRGLFWGHEVEGCSHFDGRPRIVGKPEFKEGNVVGCGVDLKTGQIIYTLNKERLDTAGLKVDSDAELYPCVTLYEPGTKIEANFGPEFEFDIAKAFKN